LIHYPNPAAFAGRLLPISARRRAPIRLAENFGRYRTKPADGAAFDARSGRRSCGRHSFGRFPARKSLPPQLPRVAILWPDPDVFPERHVGDCFGERTHAQPLIALVGAAVLVGACSEPQAVQAPPPPPAQSTSFMVFFDWDRSNITPQAATTIRQAAERVQVDGPESRHDDRPYRYVRSAGLQTWRLVAAPGECGPRTGWSSQGVPPTAISVIGPW